MLKYREENPSLVQPAQTQARPVLPSYAKTATRFQLKDHPIYPALDSPDQSEVEDEFAKYTSAPLTSEKTNILVYWQVSLILYLTRSMLTTPVTNRPIRQNFLRSMLLPWTTFRSKHLLYLANASSHQLERPTPRNETELALP